MKWMSSSTERQCDRTLRTGCDDPAARGQLHRRAAGRQRLLQGELRQGLCELRRRAGGGGHRGAGDEDDPAVPKRRRARLLRVWLRLSGGFRSHCRLVLPLIHFIPDSLTYSVPLFLKRQCDRTYFQFQDAPLPFEAMEACMAHVRARPAEYGFELAYSSPRDYFHARRHCLCIAYASPIEPRT
jgi:hypothetical protein